MCDCGNDYILINFSTWFVIRIIMGIPITSNLNFAGIIYDFF